MIKFYFPKACNILLASASIYMNYEASYLRPALKIYFPALFAVAKTVGTSGISLKRRPLLANPSKATGCTGKMVTSGSGSRRSIAGGGTCKVWPLSQVLSRCLIVFNQNW